jgi:hypothetical protein
MGHTTHNNIIYNGSSAIQLENNVVFQQKLNDQFQQFVTQLFMCVSFDCILLWTVSCLVCLICCYWMEIENIYIYIL